MTHLTENPINLIAGEGMLAPKLDIYGHSLPTHNVLLEILYSVGIIGAALYFMFLKQVFKHIGQSFYTVLPLITLLIRSFAVNMIYREAFFIQVFMIVLVTRTNIQVNGIKEKRRLIR